MNDIVPARFATAAGSPPWRTVRSTGPSRRILGRGEDLVEPVGEVLVQTGSMASILARTSPRTLGAVAARSCVVVAAVAR